MGIDAHEASRFLERYNSSRDRMACDVVRNAFLTVDKKLRWQMIVMALKFKTSPRMIYRLLKFSLFN